jgi:hypothetical protein
MPESGPLVESGHADLVRWTEGSPWAQIDMLHAVVDNSSHTDFAVTLPI